MIANKQDQSERREVTEEQGISLAKSMNVAYFPTSAKNNTNIEQAFTEMVRMINKYREIIGKGKKKKRDKSKCSLI